MKPSPFEYLAPGTVDECLTLLAQRGDDAKVLAGGQSLVPLMNLRLAAPETLIDLNRVDGLAGIREDGDRLVVGAMTRHRDVASSDVVQAACPMLAHAASLIGYPAIRNRGTIGGSLAHADPASEMPCVAVTLDAELVVAGPQGRRTVPAGDFLISHFTTALEPSELLVEIRFPRSAAGDGREFTAFSRKSGDFALVALAIDLQVRDGRVARARVGVGGVGDRPWRAEAAEALLAGAEPADELLERAAGEVGSQAANGSGDGGQDEDRRYRGHVAATLARRALRTAMDRVGG